MRRVHALATVGLLAVLGPLLAAVAPPGAEASAPPAETAPPAHTVLVGAPGLAWSDITPETTPWLDIVAREGAVGSMTVRGVRSQACGVDGWLTLSAGRRASDAAAAACSEPEPVTGDTVPSWERYVSAADAASYGAVPGTLGQRLEDAGECVETVGPGAAIAGADEAGRVEHQLTDLPDPPSCAVVVVDAGTLPPGGADRAAALADLDDLVERIVRSGGPDTQLVVAGVGDGQSPVAPRALVVAAPPAGLLTSPSTRQLGLVQLQDLTATLLADHGAEDAGLTGRPISAVADDRTGEERVAARLGFERRATTMRALAPQVTTWLAVAYALWAAVLALLLWRRRPVPGPAAATGVVLAGVPVATFLANLLPWWRVDASGWAFAGALAVAVSVVGALALATGRRLDLGGLRAVAVVTMLVLAGDVLTGSTLQLASVYGQNPTVGGRFYGLGNTSFALYGLATVVLVQWAGSCRRLGRWRLPLAGVLLLAALGLEAHPSFGADFGGPPGLLLGGLVVLAAVAGVRLTPWRVLGAVVVAGALTLAVAVVDWLRPAESRTHLGEFVQTVLDGGAGEVVTRKVSQNLANLGSPPLLAIALATVALGVVLWRTGWRPGPDGAVVLRGAAVMAAVGFAVNDSGLVIPAYVALVLLPGLVADRAAAPLTRRE
jgi:hypothetical protein